MVMRIRGRCLDGGGMIGYVLWVPPMTFLTTMAAMPASTAFAIGDVRISIIGLDPEACC